jgi:hypothetical protein
LQNAMRLHQGIENAVLRTCVASYFRRKAYQFTDMPAFQPAAAGVAGEQYPRERLPYSHRK